MSKKTKKKAESSENSNKIDAMPTKEFFIKILTRDIKLIPAIIDLVDNCGDGARRFRENRQDKNQFVGLSVRLEVTPEMFRISDNCGGISVEIAKNYAFRFGRPSDAPAIKHSVGEFGVGMKRAFFKIGNQFKVESTTSMSRFLVDVDINEWAQKEEWEYDFLELQENTRFTQDDIGTIVEITNLHEDIANSFILINFQNELKEELQTKLQDLISKGLSITINGIPIDSEPLVLISDKRLSPAYRELKYYEKGRKPVKVKLFCGIGMSEKPEQSGWHVFCNGRLILEGDKSEVTGWGIREDTRIPAFHPQYNHFRGFAYFDSDDPGKLPWNTTKTGLNTDSAIYRAVKLEMVKLMRPVVDFLNKLSLEKKESKELGERGQLEKIVTESKCQTVEKVSTRDFFEPPKVIVRKVPDGPKMRKIQYEVKEDDAREVRDALIATSWKQVGIKTFNYFYDAELGD